MKSVTINVGKIQRHTTVAQGYSLESWWNSWEELTSRVWRRAKPIAHGMTVMMNTTWQKMKLGMVIVSSSPQFRQMKILLAGERNIFRRKTEGLKEWNSPDTSCWHDGHLAMIHACRDFLFEKNSLLDESNIQKRELNVKKSTND